MGAGPYRGKSPLISTRSAPPTLDPPPVRTGSAPMRKMHQTRSTCRYLPETGCQRNARRLSAVIMSVTRHPWTACDPLRPPGGHRQPLRAVAWLAAPVLSGLLLAACGSSPSGPSTSPTATTPAAASQRTTRSTPPALSSVFGHPLLSPQVAVTPSGVYVAWQVSPPGSAAVHSELARIDAATGRIQARRRLGAAIGQLLAAAGSLWVAAPSVASRTLLRLNPDTLKVTGRWRLGASRFQAWGYRVLAVAGGRLWVAAGDRLLHLSLPGARVTGSIILPGAASSDLSANARGTVLVVGEANSGGRGAVQRRDPATGAILASYPVLGVTAPLVAGPIDSAVWVSEATGMMGYVRRLSAATLAAHGGTCAEGRSTNTCIEGTNDITARLANGLLWVIQVAGGSGRNYCANPSDGRALAPIRLPQPADDEVLAVAPRRIFYAAPGPKAGQYLRQEAIPAACRAR